MLRKIFGRESLLAFLTAILRPAARLCVRNDVLLQEVTECLKQALVKEALSELGQNALKPTVSHLSIITGVHRKDVTRLVNSEVTSKSAGPIPAQVIGLWKTDPAFRNDLDKPKLLTSDGPQSSFWELVRTVNRELNPGTILKELERVGAVRRTEQGLKLVDGAYVTRKNTSTALEMLADHSSALVAAVEENVSGTLETANLHLKTEFDAIPDRSIPEVREWLLREGTLFHERIHTYLAQHDTDCNPALKEAQGRNKVSLIAFSLVEEISLGRKSSDS